MNFIEKLALSYAGRKVKEMLQGYKVYFLCAVAAIYTLVGWLFGATDILGIQIPAYSFNEMLDKFWELALIAGFRSAANKVGK